MPKMRVHELAKLLDKSSKEIIAELKQQGVEVQSHMSTVSDEHVDKLKAKFQKKESGNNRGNNESAAITAIMILAAQESRRTIRSSRLQYSHQSRKSQRKM